MKHQAQREEATVAAPHPHRRVWLVMLSVVLAAALTGGYVAADVADILPGPLTLHGENAKIAQERGPAVVRPAGEGLVESAGTSKSVDAAGVTNAVNGLAAAPGMGSSFSVAVLGADGRQLASHDPDTPREPASTMKTMTALASSSVLDMGSRFTTSAYVRAAGGAGVASNGEAQMTLKGDGDMLLGSGVNDPQHVDGRAGLASLADQSAAALRKRGISKVVLVCDDSLFGTSRSPQHIAENNDGDLYFTGVSSVAVDGGRQRDGAVPGDPDDFDDYPPLSQTTAADTLAQFAALLQGRGIGVHIGTVAGQSSAQGVSTAPLKSIGTRIASVRSATLGEVLGFALRHSDNTLAEEFGRLTALRMSAPNSPEGATRAVKSRLGQLGIATGGLTMADCSGLSPGSQVSATTLAQAQVVNLKPGTAAAAAEGLSVPGLVGTAQNRLGDDGAAGLLRVKTGSLDTVTSMAGNVSCAHGGALAFAVVVNDPQDLGAAKSAIDTFISQLAAL